MQHSQWNHGHAIARKPHSDRLLTRSFVCLFVCVSPVHDGASHACFDIDLGVTGQGGLVLGLLWILKAMAGGSGQACVRVRACVHRARAGCERKCARVCVRVPGAARDAPSGSTLCVAGVSAAYGPVSHRI